MSKKYLGQIGRIKRECIDTYCRLHEVDIYTQKWTGICQLIADCNICNYNIYIEDDVLFGCYEYVGNDYEADMKKMAEDPLNLQWWALTRPCFTKYRANSEEAFTVICDKSSTWTVDLSCECTGK